MPFIKGRFHINPIAGQALEAAREAEAALLALEHAAQKDRQRDSGGESDASNDDAAAPPEGPIHRVEIEASEMVPSHTSRAARGFVARVHRLPAARKSGVSVGAQHAAPGEDAWQHDAYAPSSDTLGFGARHAATSSPETHIFADHRDLVSFLRDEFARDCK